MRRWYLDLAVDDDQHPVAGDVLVTKRYERPLVDVWPTDSRIWPNRWTLTLGDAVTEAPLPPGRRRIESEPYALGEGPADHFGSPR